MNRLSIVTLAVALSAGGPAAAQSSLTGQAPDLTPIASRILNGVASVRNTGSAAAGAFVLTVQCQKQGGGRCAESRGFARYEDPMYPNRLVIQVPGIAAGNVFNHTLPFWGELEWQPGSYNLLLEADPGKVVAETNEGNNFGGAVLTKP
jgi:hypothetical protein